MAWAVGERLQGSKYTIEQELGLGGFGITYRAKDNNGQCVVIKTLNEKVQRRSDFAKFQQDFLNEALRLARCSHPHIVRVDEVLQEGDLWCIVMEYIDGEDLASRVENQGTLSEAEALRHMRQIGEALTLVHSHGLLHRDVKPQNIMLRAGNLEAVLIDFGIAREFSPNLTQTHTQMSSDGFAPIEQYDKRTKRGAYTDVYAAAATLYSLLTGEVPTIAPLRAIGVPLEPPKHINSTISDQVNQAILKGMEVDAVDRPQSMQDWLSLLPNQSTNPLMDDVVRLFNAHVDYDSSNAGKLIHHKEHRKDSIRHYHITISDTHAFNCGANGFAVFRIPPKAERAKYTKLFNRREVLDRCLIAYRLFKDWNYDTLGWNCEHFARLVTTDEAISYQVKESRFGKQNYDGRHPQAKEIMDKACKG